MACGSRLSAIREEGKRRLGCRRCGWKFYNNPVPAAVALVVKGRKILLGRRAAAPYKGTWDLPGGFLEGDEAPEVALRRELVSELRWFDREHLPFQEISFPSVRKALRQFV
jgi:NADH pyrophosphatase NudC (nudix superfamily)